MNRLEQLIGRFLDDVLTVEERTELERVIAIDSTAADQLNAYYQQDRLLASLFRPAPEDAVNAIMAAVSAEDGFVDSVMREARAATLQDLPGGSRRSRAGAAAKAQISREAGVRSLGDWLVGLIPRPAWVVAVATGLLLGLLAWAYLPVAGEPTLTIASGTGVILEHNGQTLLAQDGLKLSPGDLLRVSGANGAALGYGNENTRITITDNTELKILAWNKGKRFELHRGKLEATVARQQPWHPMVLVTAQAEARVLGTKFALLAMINNTTLEVTKGTVQLTGATDLKPIKVGAGQSAVAGAGYVLPALPGKVFREFWLNLPGDSLHDLTYHARYPSAPSGHDYPANFETSTNWTSAFGTRTRAYLLPRVSGEYEFRISGNGQVCLWLSGDEDPFGRTRVAQIIFTRNRPGDPLPEESRSQQTSGPIPLLAGKCYYIEATHKYGTGDDQLSIVWKRPDGTEEPIPSEVLAPFTGKKGSK